MEPLRYGSKAGRGVLLATVLGSGVVFLDATVVNVALPTLQRELHTGLDALQWTVDAYLLTLSALLLLGGSLGDRLGRRRVFIAGLIWFAVASVACGVAPNAGLLIAARALQGVGGALLVPGSLALLRGTFAPQDEPRAIGAWSGLSGVTTALGPALGGWLIEHGSWRMVFFLNVPLAALAIWAALRFVPAVEGSSEREPLDLLGAFLAALGLGAVSTALIEGPALGFGSPLVLTASVLGPVALAAFLIVEARSAHPMLPLSLFRSRQFSGANATTLAVYFALGGAIFLLVLQLQSVQHETPLQAGFALVPLTVLLLLLSPLAGKIAAEYGPRGLMTAGPLCAAVGLFLLSRLRPEDSYARGVFPGVVVLGLGLSATVAPLTSAMLDGVEAAHAGIASGVNNAIARLAGLLAVAVLPLAGGLAEAQAADEKSLAAGYGPAMRLAAVICALGGVCSGVTLGPSSRRV